MTEPKVGDRVRTTLTHEGVVTEVAIDGAVYVDGHYMSDRYAVEILERADDPARDPVGTIRILNADGATGVFHKDVTNHWQHFTAPGAYDDERMRRHDTQVIGVILGTPAAGPAAKAGPEYEYYRNNDIEYRVKGGIVEFWCNEYWKPSGSFPRRVLLMDSGNTTKLDGKPADVD